MELTAQEMELIRYSFRALAPERVQAAEHFYRRLFELDPATRKLFIGDMNRQGAKLVSTLGLIVAELQNWRDLAPLVEDLALRHVAYGVKPEHYATVGKALMAMFEATLGDDFTPETEAARSKAYTSLAEFMITAAYR